MSDEIKQNNKQTEPVPAEQENTTQPAENNKPENQPQKSLQERLQEDKPLNKKPKFNIFGYMV